MAGLKIGRFAGIALSALVLVAGSVLMSACSSSSTSDGDDGTPETFSVNQPGDRMEVNLNTTGPASFHFEAKGFTDNFRSNQDGEWQYVYFWIYNGDNFYYKGDGEGFLYIPFQYAYNNYYCNYGKVKGRSDNPGGWPLEGCYMSQDTPWDPTKWYTFDVNWDGSTITLSMDGVVKHSGHLDPASRNLIAGLGWPPAGSETEGLVGMEFRNWSFKKL